MVILHIRTSDENSRGSLDSTTLGKRSVWTKLNFLKPQEAEAERRGSFSCLEASWQNEFELRRYLTTLVLFRPRRVLVAGLEEPLWPSLLLEVSSGHFSGRDEVIPCTCSNFKDRPVQHTEYGEG